MPAKTERQARFMRLCEHHPEAAKGKCPPKAVAKEFNHTAGQGSSDSRNKGAGHGRTS